MKTRWLSQNRGILLFTLLGVAIVLTLSQTGTRGNPNPRPVAYPGTAGVPQVVLKENQLSQYVTTGRINGEKVEFLVDTGAADIAMPYRVAQRLGLQLNPGGISKTGNGNVQSWSARLDRVDIGGLVAEQVSATVLPHMVGDQVLLGMAYLRHMEMVLAGGRMTLRPYLTP